MKRMVSIAMVAAPLLAAACGGAGPSPEHSTSPPPSPTATAAPSTASSAALDADISVCHDFAQLVGSVDRLLSAAETDPSSIDTTPGASSDLLNAAEQMSGWSHDAVVVSVDGRTIDLPSHLNTASSEIQGFVAGASGPNGAVYAQSAHQAVQSVARDCVAVLGA